MFGSLENWVIGSHQAETSCRHEHIDCSCLALARFRIVRTDYIMRNENTSPSFQVRQPFNNTMPQVICTCSTCSKKIITSDHGQRIPGHRVSSETRRQHQIRDRRADLRARHSHSSEDASESATRSIPEQTHQQAAPINIDLGKCLIFFLILLVLADHNGF